jgi:hypothetical protein
MNDHFFLIERSRDLFSLEAFYRAWVRERGLNPRHGLSTHMCLAKPFMELGARTGLDPRHGLSTHMCLATGPRPSPPHE